jgi:hypothetical protein
MTDVRSVETGKRSKWVDKDPSAGITDAERAKLRKLNKRSKHMEEHLGPAITDELRDKILELSKKGRS